jgi:hypothetical protein
MVMVFGPGTRLIGALYVPDPASLGAPLMRIVAGTVAIGRTRTDVTVEATEAV